LNEAEAIRKLAAALSLLFFAIAVNRLSPNMALTGMALCKEALELIGDEE
jgi:type III secretory pathway component EscR